MGGVFPRKIEPPRIAHRDPFDRMLAWQAIQRNLVLISKDAALPAYREAGLKTLW